LTERHLSRWPWSNTISGDLPPSSSVTCLSPSAAARATRSPVGTEPVTDTLDTDECDTSAAPTSPAPCTTLNAPAGSPAAARISASARALNGVSSDGLNTIELPAASAGAAFQQ